METVGWVFRLRGGEGGLQWGVGREVQGGGLEGGGAGR